MCTKSTRSTINTFLAHSKYHMLLYIVDKNMYCNTMHLPPSGQIPCPDGAVHGGSDKPASVRTKCLCVGVCACVCVCVCVSVGVCVHVQCASCGNYSEIHYFYIQKTYTFYGTSLLSVICQSF